MDGVVSSWVQIDITSVYAASCNGFVEVEVYTGYEFSKYSLHRNEETGIETLHRHSTELLMFI